MTWRELSLDDASAVNHLRREVLEHLRHPDMYVRETKEDEFVKGHLGEFGVSYGYEEGGELVGYCALTTDLITSGEAPEFEACSPRVDDVVLAATMILPQHRGRSLHRDAIRLRLQKAEHFGAQRALVQVSPHNIPSLRGLFAESFRCIAVDSYADARSRILLAREVSEAASRGLIQDLSLVDIHDFERIRTELQSGRQAHDVVPSDSGGLLVVGA